MSVSDARRSGGIRMVGFWLSSIRNLLLCRFQVSAPSSLGDGVCDIRHADAAQIPSSHAVALVLHGDGPTLVTPPSAVRRSLRRECWSPGQPGVRCAACHRSSLRRMRYAVDMQRCHPMCTHLLLCRGSERHPGGQGLIRAAAACAYSGTRCGRVVSYPERLHAGRY